MCVGKCLNDLIKSCFWPRKVLNLWTCHLMTADGPVTTYDHLSCLRFGWITFKPAYARWFPPYFSSLTWEIMVGDPSGSPYMHICNSKTAICLPIWRADSQEKCPKKSQHGPKCSSAVCFLHDLSCSLWKTKVGSSIEPPEGRVCT